MNNIEYYYNYKKRIEQIFYPPLSGSKNKIEHLNKLIGHDNIRYYSYARHALLEGLKCINLRKDDSILIPSFICRDLLSSINSIGAEIKFYDVDKNLYPVLDHDKLPKAKAILAVNYFGFPQNLDNYLKYCKRNKAILIEDNAHGFLSSDQNGIFLGTRGDIGIFSIRKTLPVFNGAALTVNNKKYLVSLNPQLEFQKKISLYFKYKKIIRSLLPIIKIKGLIFLTKLVRIFRKVFKGYETDQSDPEAEIKLPLNIKPSIDLLSGLNKINYEEEILRRREIFIWLIKKFEELNIPIVFDNLPKNCVPYCFPFYASKKEIIGIKNILKSYNLECFQWPDIPTKIKFNVPNFYNKIWCIKFLW